MKRKAIATAVAAALALPVTTAALAACPADGARPFLAGPVNPTNGFAEYVQDSNNLALELCLTGDPNAATAVCFFDPAIPGVPFSEQIGFGPEAFWWLAEGALDTAATDPVNGDTFSALVVMAAEAAFATEVPADGDQFPFTRLRIRINAPFPGIYTLTHPYGTATYVVPADGITAGQEIRESFDIVFTPNQQNQGRVGPWLQQVAGPFTFPEFPGATFIGNGDVGPVEGSPCGNNFVRVSTAPLVAGDPPVIIDPQDIDNDGSVISVGTTDFAVFGKIFDGKLGTALISERTTYDRAGTPNATGQVDAFATSTATANVTVSSVAAPTTDLVMAAPGGTRRWNSEVLANAGALPPTVEVKASEPTATTDPTRLVRLLTDVVRITKAEYNATTNVLLIEANSSDASVTPTLTVAEFGRPANTGIATLAPPATVSVFSSAGGSDTELVTVIAAAAGPNNPPVAVNDSANVLEDTPTDIAVLPNDLDQDGDPLSISAVTQPLHGVVTTNGANVTYAPAANYNGPDAFTYTASDGRGGSSIASVNVTVVPVNDAPIAGTDAATTAEDTAVIINVLANDSDVDGNPLTISAVTQPASGTVINNGNSVTFTPAANFNGLRTFTYTVSDGNGGSATATVNVTVTPVNDAPVAVNDSVSTPPGVPVTISVLGNDTDVDGPTPLAVVNRSAISPVTAGALVTNANQTVTFTPAAGFTGAASFTYQARDAANLISANTATVTINVDPTLLVDLDIVRLTVPTSVNRGQVVNPRLQVINNGTVPGARTARITAVRFPNTPVYNQSLTVNLAPGANTTLTFPNFTSAVAGTIVWTATVLDDNPDVDQAQATTLIR
jgi:hypothetical protein